MIKRVFDITTAAAAIFLLSPVLAATALFVAFRIGRPILFAQDRAGLHGRPFRMYKFRTMTDARDPSGSLLPDEDRLTRPGRMLRSTSLDELPELWNILRGDMSFVGPRPLLVRYLSRYNAEQARRHDVRPGLTGYAQINGRNSLTWDERFSLDTWYVDHRSFALDLRIILLTGMKVFDRKGINSPDNATMSEFLGSDRLPPGEAPSPSRATPPPGADRS